MKQFKFKAKCPKCNKINNFIVYAEEVKNDYDYSCSFCEKENPLSKYNVIDENGKLR